MKRPVPLLLLSALLPCFGCGAARYAWELGLVEPGPAEPMVYENTDVLVKFSLFKNRWRNDQLAFSVLNKTKSALTIDWDRCAFVDTTGESHRIYHRSTHAHRSEALKAPIVIPPGATIRSGIYVATDVHSAAQGLNMFLPGRPKGDYVGQRFSLFMPIRSESAVTEYRFVFRVDEVYVVRGSSRKPAKRSPD